MDNYWILINGDFKKTIILLDPKIVFMVFILVNYSDGCLDVDIY